MHSNIVLDLWNLTHIWFYAEISPEFNDSTTLERGWNISYCLGSKRKDLLLKHFVIEAFNKLFVLYYSIICLFFAFINLVVLTINYRPQRSWGKVIFSQASVIVSTGIGGAWSRGGGAWSGGECSRGGAWWRPPGTSTAAGGMHPTGMHSC